MHVHVEVGNVMIVHMAIRIMRLGNQALVNVRIYVFVVFLINLGGGKNGLIS